MNPPCAFIFDLDGTIVDSLPDIHLALNHALTQLKLPTVDIRQTRSWVGDGLPALCRRAAPQLDEHRAAELLHHARHHYAAHVVDHTRPFPNIMQMLDLLQRMNFPAAVLTNKPHDLAVAAVEQLNMSRCFVDVVGYRREEDKKPCPAPAITLATRLGVAPECVFLVGDSLTDIRTARAAGMIAVAVAWGYQNFSDLAAAGVDFLVRTPLEVPDLPMKKNFLPHPPPAGSIEPR